MAGEMAGTLAYMPPEQLRNFRDVKPQSDIYAVGMTAYSLLTGCLALDLSKNSSVNDTIRAIFEQPAVPLRQRAPHIPATCLRDHRSCTCKGSCTALANGRRNAQRAPALDFSPLNSVE